MINVAFCNFPKSLYVRDLEELNLEVRQFFMKRNQKITCNYVEDVLANTFYNFYISYVTRPEDVISISDMRRVLFRHSEVILVADSLDFALLGFQNSCLGYLVLPIQKDRLHDVLVSMYENYRKKNICIYGPDGVYNVNPSQILYANIECRNICYHMLDGREIYGNVLKTSFKNSVNQDLLGNNVFMFLSPSLIINLEQLYRITKDCRIEFLNGVQYPISKRHKEEICDRIGCYRD